MLIGIPPLLAPEFLAVLRAMGHGDEIAIVDGNYPAAEHGRRVIRCDGHGLIDVARAVLSVLPVDDCVPEALFRASPNGDPARADPIHHRMEELCNEKAKDHRLVPLPGPAFYDRVRAAYAVIATSEPALYANMIIRKGVIRP